MGQKSIIIALGLIIFTVILTVLFVISRFRSGSDNPEKKPTEVTSSQPIRNVVPVSEIIQNPMVYDEYNLEIDSQITDWATNRAFYFTARIGSGFGGGTPRNLLVIAKEPFALPQSQDDDKVGLGETSDVTAYGRVEILNTEQLEAALGIDLENPTSVLYDQTLRKWTIGPVIMLDKVEINSSK